ncbi:MAG: hypothetical protein LUE20_02405 [Oscillospiraceae bacterium]|nr:hypothetical protein [Oscillospiraceae bacterium]
MKEKKNRAEWIQYEGLSEIDLKRVERGLQEFFENPYWKKHYEKAPSDICREYIALGFARSVDFFDCKTDVDNSGLKRRKEELTAYFDIEDWRYTIINAGHYMAKINLCKQMEEYFPGCGNSKFIYGME